MKTKLDWLQARHSDCDSFYCSVTPVTARWFGKAQIHPCPERVASPFLFLGGPAAIVVYDKLNLMVLRARSMNSLLKPYLSLGIRNLWKKEDRDG
jgi:hypothetical protein